jgi:sodium-dependent dicarboxylate transporter 2/3/5
MKKAVPLVIGLYLFFYYHSASIRFNTWEIQATVAINLLMVIWWITEFVLIPVTALIPLIGFPLCGIMSPRNASASYGDKVIFLFLGGFIICAAIERWNLHRRIALSIILHIGNSPRKLIFGFMVATAFISIWISNTATAMMMIPIGISIIGVLGFDSDRNDDIHERSDIAKALVIAIAYAATIDGMGSLIGTPPNNIFIAQLKTLYPGAPSIGFLDWMAFGIPFVAMFLPLTLIGLVYGPFRNLPDRLPHSREIIQSEIY